MVDPGRTIIGTLTLTHSAVKIPVYIADLAFLPGAANTSAWIGRMTERQTRFR